MDSLDAILADLIATLDVELQEGRTTVVLPPDLAAALQGRTLPAASAPTAAPPRENAPAAAAIAQPAPPAGPPRDLGGAASLADVAARVADCRLCDLHRTRQHTVPGVGPRHPDIAFIGEAPGADEDRQGLPFVGRAGQLLTRMIEAMGYRREEVFIANVLKCRPPGNRTPTPHEMALCMPYLRRQIALLQPKVLVALGATAAQGLLRGDRPIGQLRGRWQAFDGIPLMPTFHPSYLLRMPVAKREAWADLKLVLVRLGRQPPAALANQESA